MACSVTGPSCRPETQRAAGSARRRRRESPERAGLQSRLACSIRSCDDDTKFHHICRGASSGSPPNSIALKAGLRPQHVARAAVEQDQVLRREVGVQLGLALQHVERAFRRLGSIASSASGSRSSATLKVSANTRTGDSHPEAAPGHHLQVRAGMPAFRQGGRGMVVEGRRSLLVATRQRYSRSAFRAAHARRRGGRAGALECDAAAGGHPVHVAGQDVLQAAQRCRDGGSRRPTGRSRWPARCADAGARRCRGWLEQRRPHVVDEHERADAKRACRVGTVRRTSKPPPRSWVRGLTSWVMVGLIRNAAASGRPATASALSTH